MILNNLPRFWPRLAETLGQRLILLFALAMLPPTGISLYFAWDAYTQNIKQTKLSVRQLALLAATFERKFFDEIRETLGKIADEPNIRAPVKNKCRSRLDETLKNSPRFAGLAIYDSMGMLVCGTDRSLADVSMTPWFRNARKSRGFAVSDYTYTPDSPYPVIVGAQALYDEQGVYKGLFSASVELYWLSAFLKEVPLPSEGVFFLLDREGNVLANSSSFLNNANSALPKESATASGIALKSTVHGEFIQKVLAGQISDFEATGTDGVERLYASAALPYGAVTLLFGVPSVPTLGWIRQDFIARLLGLAAIWIIGVGTAAVGTRLLVTRWTSALRKMALTFGRGDYLASLDLRHAPTELRDLGDTLMLMANRIQAREEALHESLAHKDILIKETHHRVKNNMQIVSSLLNLHGDTTDGPNAREALQEVKTRIRALALVHRHLYEGEDVRVIGLSSFLSDLCRTMIKSLSHTDSRIDVKLEIPEIMILSDRAVPIALLVVEAITNSLKHAFPNGRPGEITIAFEEQDASQGMLVVADDGVGFSRDSADEDRLGLRLMDAFARQIGGELTVTGPPGTRICVVVKLDTLTGRSRNALLRRAQTRQF